MKEYSDWFNDGVLLGLLSRYLAEWMTYGYPTANVWPLDVKRFGSLQSSRTFLRHRVMEVVRECGTLCTLYIYSNVLFSILTRNILLSIWTVTWFLSFSWSNEETDHTCHLSNYLSVNCPNTFEPEKMEAFCMKLLYFLNGKRDII